jgi:hypothetical protein
MILRGENRRTLRKTCPSATLSTTNPTKTALGVNPGFNGEKPATNRLSNGTAVENTHNYPQYNYKYVNLQHFINQTENIFGKNGANKNVFSKINH